MFKTLSPPPPFDLWPWSISITFCLTLTFDLDWHRYVSFWWWTLTWIDINFILLDGDLWPGSTSIHFCLMVTSDLDQHQFYSAWRWPLTWIDINFIPFDDGMKGRARWLPVFFDTKMWGYVSVLRQSQCNLLSVVLKSRKRNYLYV